MVLENPRIRSDDARLLKLSCCLYALRCIAVQVVNSMPSTRVITRSFVCFRPLVCFDVQRSTMSITMSITTAPQCSSNVVRNQRAATGKQVNPIMPSSRRQHLQHLMGLMVRAMTVLQHAAVHAIYRRGL